MKIKNLSIFKALYVFQLGLVLLSLLLIAISIYSVISVNTLSMIEKKKDILRYQLLPYQEKWRSWKFMGIDSELEAEISEVKELFGIKQIQILDRMNIPKSHDYLVIPEQSDDLTDFALAIDVRDLLSDMSVFSNGNILTLLAVAFALVFLVYSFISYIFIRSKLIKPVTDIYKAFQNYDSNTPLDLDRVNAKGEIGILVSEIQKLFDQNKRNSYLAAKGKIARQVSHDIKSPLTVIKALVANSHTELDNVKTSIAKSACERISKIIEDLSEDNAQTNAAVEKYNLVEALSCILEEKRLEFRDAADIKQNIDLQESLHALAVPESDFKRILSNLINNSCEAIMHNKPQIEIGATFSNHCYKVAVTDNGPGIPLETRNKIFDYGYSSGKPGGSGLGLYHAHKVLKSVGGDISIDDNYNLGTKIILTIPVLDHLTFH